MAHPFAPDLGQRNLDTAFLADDAAVLHPLVLAAQAFVILDRPKNPGTEQAVAFGFEGPVIDGLRLLDFTVGPRTDAFGARDRNLDLVEALSRADLAEDVHQFIHLPSPGIYGLRESAMAGTNSRSRRCSRIPGTQDS